MTNDTSSRFIAASDERWLLLGTILASSMATIDFSALNVALPAIQRELHVTGNVLLWIVNAYSLFLSALLLTGGSLGDHFGRKRVTMIGIIVFSLSSALCGLAPNHQWLIAGRAIQGMGAALLIPGSLSLIASLVEQPRRGKAFGTWSMFGALTTIAGPVLGGILAGNDLWRVIFFINLPIGAIALWVLGAKVPESTAVKKEPLDIPGAVLATVGLAGISYGFIEAPRLGFDNPWIIAALAAGGLSLALFLWNENRSHHPMMPLTLFRFRNFATTNFLTLLVYGALSAGLFFLPLNLIQVQGYTEELVGLVILPFALLIGGISRFAGAFNDKYGPRWPLTVGPAITGLGFFTLSLPGITAGFSDYWTTFFPPTILLGVGMGITVAPLTTTVMSALDESFSGIASGVNNAVARTAGVLAIAILGALALVHFRSTLMEQVQPLQFTEVQQHELQKEALELAEAKPPAQLSQEKKAQVEQAIDQSFVKTFGVVNIVTAVLCWAGGAVCWFLIKKPQ